MRRPSRKRGARPATREGTVPDGMRKLWALLSPAERRTFLRVAAGMTLLGLLDMSSVASVMPFLALAGNPDLLEGHPLFRQIGGRIGVTDVTTMLILLGSLVVVVIVARNAFSAFIHWRAMKFAWSSNHRLARSQLDRYLHRPYIYFVQHNTSGAKVNILSEINTITNNVMMPSMEMITGTVSVVSVVTVLVFVDWKLALLTTGILGGSYGLAYVAVKGRLKRLGRRSVAANRERFQSVSEAFGGIKEVIALGRRDEFVQRFSVPSWRLAQYRVAHRIISQMPKYILETIAFAGIVLIVIYLLADRAELGAALAVVGLYAVAGFRLLPALQAVFGSGAAIRYNLAAVDFVHDDFFGEEEYPPVPRREAAPVAMRVERGLRLVEVSYRYPGSDIQAVQDVDIEIPSRHTVALVGHTGAGKTTIVDLILGLLRPQVGRLEVDGVALDDENLAAWQSAIGYVPQFIYLSDDTITRNIAFGLPESEISEEAVHRAARLAHLHEFIESLPDGYSTVVGERGIRLSGGQRQRIGIARALYHDPQVLLFDEATSSLDGITEEEVMKDIRGLADRKTIILVAHRLSTVRHAQAIYLLDGGRIVARGTYDELQRESAVFRRMSAGPSAVPGRIE